MPGSTTIVAPGEAASIAAWSESPSCTTTLAGVFAAEARVVVSNSARAVITGERDMVDSFDIARVPSGLSRLTARKRFEPGARGAPPARDVLVRIRALSRSAKAARCRGAGRYAPARIRYCQMRPVV